jgi:CPA1 family monovalent cation:H+ antiporter
MLTIFEIAALLLGLSALFGWFNLRFLKLPHTIGLLIMALASSLMLIGIEKLFPGLGITPTLQTAIGRIDFYTAIINGILAFLLFAGALHVDFDALSGQKWAIGLMASIGVVISIAVASLGIFRPAGCSASTCRCPGRWCSAR